MKPLPAFLIDYSDSSFTNPHDVVRADAPPDCQGVFTHMGAKYSGFESARHRATSVLAGEAAFAYDHNAHNWFVIGLKARSEVSEVRISTKWFTGNQVRFVSVFLIDGEKKTRVLERVPLKPDADHVFEIAPAWANKCQVECYYEGGIARVHLFGQAQAETPRENLLDKAEISYVSNIHYGDPARAVRGNREEEHMFGWESARTGFGERALFHLEKPAGIGEIVVDTYLHRLNAPLSCHVFGAKLETDGTDAAMALAPRWKLVLDDGREIMPEDFQAYILEQRYLQEGVSTFKIRLHMPDKSPWRAILPFAPLRPDAWHAFKDLQDKGPFSHILYMHYPNGGIHGLKVFAA